MKFPVIAASLVAAVAFASPADAAKKRKQAPHQQPAAMQSDANTVRDSSGQVAGRDPDPNIRAMIRKDPRPWEGTN